MWREIVLEFPMAELRDPAGEDALLLIESS